MKTILHFIIASIIVFGIVFLPEMIVSATDPFCSKIASSISEAAVSLPGIIFTYFVGFLGIMSCVLAIISTRRK